MAKVRKRTLPSGKIRWLADYTDSAGQRRAKQFERKNDAEAWLVETRHDIVRGLHTAQSIAPTVREAGTLWIKRCYGKGLEAATIKGYEEHCNLHIFPLLGSKKLTELTPPSISAFADKLRENGRSPEMVRRAVRSLGAIYRECRRRGLASSDPTTGINLYLPGRKDPRVVAPSKSELRAMLAMAQGLWRPLLLVAIFCGLRASELRGLRWLDVDFETRQINVVQRADVFHKIGRLKSNAAYRSVPLPPEALSALREWKLACPKGEADLVFPNGAGRVESLSNLMQRGFNPIQVAAEVVNHEGRSKYGMHALRHACASLWIESGVNPKRIQKLLGHSSIQMTFDRYGHWFNDSEADQQAAEDIQSRLLGL